MSARGAERRADDEAPDSSTPTSIRIPNDVRERITKACGREQAVTGKDMKLSTWVLRAIERELEREEKKR